MKKIVSLLCICALIMSTAGCQFIPGVGSILDNLTQKETEAPTEPERQAMTPTDLAEYVGKRTVTVSVDTEDGYTSTGSGFFIDSNGTLVTNYHVIDGAKSISVEISDSAKYDVAAIVDFSEMYDLAVLKLDLDDTLYLEFCEEEPKTGEEAFAIGSSLGFLDGTFSNGIISNASRTVGRIECIQSTAATSNGNSGGPLVNVYGEVMGVNSFGYNGGENLNLAIKHSMLDKLSMDKNWSISQFREWYKKETDRSYKFWDGTNDEWIKSKTNTYQYVTGQECFGSDYGWGILEGDTEDFVNGYNDTRGVYFYEYVASEFDQYTQYLSDNGYSFIESEDYSEGTSYFYMNEFSGAMIDMFILDGDEFLIIEPYYE